MPLLVSIYCKKHHPLMATPTNADTNRIALFGDANVVFGAGVSEEDIAIESISSFVPFPIFIFEVCFVKVAKTLLQ